MSPEPSVTAKAEARAMLTARWAASAGVGDLRLTDGELPERWRDWRAAMEAFIPVVAAALQARDDQIAALTSQLRIEHVLLTRAVDAEARVAALELQKNALVAAKYSELVKRVEAEGKLATVEGALTRLYDRFFLTREPREDDALSESIRRTGE